jgi:hypothetical protein
VIVRSLKGVVDAKGVARAASRHSLPCALKLAEAGSAGRTAIAANPVRVVRGSSVDELADAWAEARTR